MNQRIREWIMDWTGWAMNWVWEHIIRNAHDGSLFDSFGWWLDDWIGRLFFAAYQGSDQELIDAEEGIIPEDCMSPRQRDHIGLGSYPRRCTSEELDSLYNCLCPVCGTPTLLEGPHGGECVNVMCGRCRSKWNIAPILQCCEALQPPSALSISAHA